MPKSPDPLQPCVAPYLLEDQVGFILRRASQRHLSIFGGKIATLTTMQFAALAKLAEGGPLSQNALGRVTAMDGATIKGVVERLGARGLVVTSRDQQDRRRSIVSLTNKGRAEIAGLIAPALAISDQTLGPLTTAERATFLALLRKLI